MYGDVFVDLGLRFAFVCEQAPAAQQADGGLALLPIFGSKHFLDHRLRLRAHAVDGPEGGVTQGAFARGELLVEEVLLEVDIALAEAEREAESPPREDPMPRAKEPSPRRGTHGDRHRAAARAAC